MGNEALDVNGMTNTVTTNNHITRRGSDWYFAVCAVMAVSSLVFMGLSFTKTRSQRIFRMCSPSRKAVAFHHVSFALLPIPSVQLPDPGQIISRLQSPW
jgi:bacteriorhodopsin